MEEQIKKLLKDLRLNESLISTVIGVVVVMLAGSLLFNFFSKKSTQPLSNLDLGTAEVSDSENSISGQNMEAANPIPANTHEVVKGETLWSIAEKYYKSGYNWVDIASDNKLKNPNGIETGMKLSIPSVSPKKQTVADPKAATIDTNTKVEVVSDTASTTIQSDKYTVAAGDSLWSISVRAYGDGYQWTKIYQANKDKVGANPDQVEKGVELSLPR